MLTKLDPGELYRSHCDSGCRFTIASCHREVKIDFGVLDVDAASSRLVGHREKPNFEFDVSMGMYVMDRSLLDTIPPNTPFGVDTLALDMLRRKDPVNIYRYRGVWLDLGRPSDFEAANEHFDESSPPNTPE